MIYLPAATIVTLWFVKKRATVTGIVMAGSGFGGMFYSLIVPGLITQYTWRGCILILSAVNLHCIVAAILFLPLELYDPIVKQEVENENDQSLFNSSIRLKFDSSSMIKSNETFSNSIFKLDSQNKQDIQVNRLFLVFIYLIC